MSWRSLMVLVCLLWGWLAAAGEAEPPPTVTWEEVAAQVATGPAALAAQARVRAAQAAVSTARQYPNPELSVRRGGSGTEDRTRDNALWGIEVALPLESVFLRRQRVRRATAGVGTARSEADVARLEVRQQLRLLYLAVAYDQALAASYATAMEQLAQMVEYVRVRVRQGESRAVELARLEGEQAEAQGETEAAAAEARANRQRLALWLNREGPADFGVDMDLQVLPALWSAEDLRRRLIEHHPRLKAARNRAQEAAAAMGVAAYTALPGVVVGGVYERDAGVSNHEVGVSLTVPLWNWNRSEVAAAKAELQRATEEAAWLERQLNEETLRLHGRASAVWAAAAQYTTRILPNSVAVLAVVESSYRAGETSLLDLLDARRQAVRTRATYLALVAEYHALWTELDLLTGVSENG